MGERPPDEPSLADRARKGDAEAFRLLFESSAGRVRARIERNLPAYLLRKVSIADVPQETRMAAFRRFEDYGPERGPFGNWLLGIADYKVRETVRHHSGTAKRATGREISRGGRPDTAAFIGRGPSPEEEAMASELRDRARVARGALPADYAEVLRLVHEEGLTLREVGEEMGRSREAVKKLYGRALCRFREVFGPREEQDDG